MNRRISRGPRAAACAAAMLLLATPVALGSSSKATPISGDGSIAASPFAEGPPNPSNLPGKAENTQVVGKYQVPGVKQGQIADLAVFKGFAYLNSWDDPDCEGGGTHVVDIRDPASPKAVTFIPAPEPYYHGEGAHVVSLDVPGFKGDVLAVNDETYGSNLTLNSACAPADKTGGGFDLYDVSNPAKPVALVQGFGDFDDDNDPSTDPRDFANSYHSVFVWQDGPRAYLVASDNTELTDVDIFDITNPRVPVQVGDHDLVELFPQIMDNERANGQAVFLHDMVVKKIDNKPILKADYWDAGYVQLDVTDPANPKYVNDTTFAQEDPLRPGTGLTPEGNAHQGEFSHDGQFLLTADEDFSPFRNVVRATSGPTSGRTASGNEGDAVARVSGLPDQKLNGPSMFVGDGCDPATIPAAPADDGNPNTDDIALVERGTCSFADKFDNVQGKGWDGLIMFNQIRPDDGQVNMLTGDGGIPGVHMRRKDAIGSTGVLADGGDPQTTPTPAPGTAGPNIVIGQEFDGWGYAHLYDAKTAQELDAYSIDEGQDPRFADGFGDLSIHEMATDSATNLAYSSYYAGGLRVFRYGRQSGLEEVGAWIADGGSNFWGVEQLTAANGEHLIAGSDRDFGLVILRYTGPGAVGPTPASGGGTTPPATGPKTGRCTNLLAVTAGKALTGSDFGEQVTGTEGADIVDAKGGDDCIDGLGGDDDLRGGAGVDTIDGQKGNDRVRGDSGRGNLRGGTGNDRVTGGSLRDTLFGNTGRDRLSGGGGNDSLLGGSGNDRITGGKGKNVIEGGTGNDRIYAKNGRTDRIDCGFGKDNVVSRDRSDKLTSCEKKASLKKKKSKQ